MFSSAPKMQQMASFVVSLILGTMLEVCCEGVDMAPRKSPSVKILLKPINPNQSIQRYYHLCPQACRTT